MYNIYVCWLYDRLGGRLGPSCWIWWDPAGQAWEREGKKRVWGPNPSGKGEKDLQTSQGLFFLPTGIGTCSLPARSLSLLLPLLNLPTYTLFSLHLARTTGNCQAGLNVKSLIKDLMNLSKSIMDSPKWRSPHHCFAFTPRKMHRTQKSCISKIYNLESSR